MRRSDFVGCLESGWKPRTHKPRTHGASHEPLHEQSPQRNGAPPPGLQGGSWSPRVVLSAFTVELRSRFSFLRCPYCRGVRGGFYAWRLVWVGRWVRKGLETPRPAAPKGQVSFVKTHPVNSSIHSTCKRKTETYKTDDWII